MPTALPNLPPLSPDDRALLRDVVAAHEDLAAVAAATGRDLFDLYAWAASDAIAPWLALHRSQQLHADRAAALHTLRTTLREASNPVEQRRAATALLRAHAPHRPRPAADAAHTRPPTAPPTTPPTPQPAARPAPPAPPPGHTPRGTQTLRLGLRCSGLDASLTHAVPRAHPMTTCAVHEPRPLGVLAEPRCAAA